MRSGESQCGGEIVISTAKAGMTVLSEQLMLNHTMYLSNGGLACKGGGGVIIRKPTVNSVFVYTSLLFAQATFCD